MVFLNKNLRNLEAGVSLLLVLSIWLKYHVETHIGKENIVILEEIVWINLKCFCFVSINKI